MNSLTGGRERLEASLEFVRKRHDSTETGQHKRWLLGGLSRLPKPGAKNRTLSGVIAGYRTLSQLKEIPNPLRWRQNPLLCLGAILFISTAL